jgi:hypothetical protein
MFSTCIILFGIIISISTINQQEAYAHKSKMFGNITLEVGWQDEPPLVGDLNAVIISVGEGPEESSMPVLNALGEITSLLKYGTLTEGINFVPSEAAEGLYEAKLIPTRTGSAYAVILNGTIKGQVISTEIPLDNVESKEKYSFPHNSSADANPSSGGGAISSNMQGVLSQMANAQQNSQNAMEKLSQELQNTTETAASLRSYIDNTFFVSLSSIGIGLAGIVIGAFSLSRRIRIQ